VKPLVRAASARRDESDEAMPAIGAQREMERVGRGKLQRRIARKGRGKRPRGGGKRQSPRAVPGEIVEVYKRRAGDLGAEEPGARTAVNQGKEFGSNPIADVKRLVDVLKPGKSAGRMRVDK
jgi:hypothetical protein